MSPFHRYKGLFLLAFALICLSLLVYFTDKDTRGVSIAESRLWDILTPVEKPFFKAAKGGQALVERFNNLRSLEVRNKSLRDRIAFLESQTLSLEEDKRENLRLKRLLALRDTGAKGGVAARVIARDPADWSSTLVVDKGSAEGIMGNMPVLAPGGLVGRIRSVGKHNATVLLILDSRSAVSALDRRSRDIVICEGSGSHPGLVTVKPLNAAQVGGTQVWSSQIRMKVGDLVVSSGLGGIYPKGYPIGRIISIGAGRYGVSKSALAKPLVDFGRLEEVLILPKGAEAL